MKAILLIIVILICLVVGEKEGSLPTFPNIGYLGAGYDILLGNPHAIGKIDPGFRSPIFNLSDYSNHNISADNRYSIPNGVSAEPAPACNLNFVNNMISGSKSYQHSVGSGVQGGVSAWVAKFSGSLDFQTAQTLTEKQESIIITSESRCEVYQTTIEAYAPPSFTDNFIDGIRALPEEYDETSYFYFVQEFGTHVIMELSMGASFGQQSIITKDSFSFMYQSQFQISEGAGASAKEAALGEGALNSDEIKLAQQYNSLVQQSNLFTSGSRPPLNGTSQEWAANATLYPMPLDDFYVFEIDQLILDYLVNLTDAGNVTQKVENLQTFFNDYCSFLSNVLNVSLDCNGIPADRNINQSLTYKTSVQCDVHGFSYTKGFFIQYPPNSFIVDNVMNTPNYLTFNLVTGNPISYHLNILGYMSTTDVDHYQFQVDMSTKTTTWLLWLGGNDAGQSYTATMSFSEQACIRWRSQSSHYGCCIVNVFQ